MVDDLMGSRVWWGLMESTMTTPQRLRDFTVAMLDALPVGSQFEDARDPADLRHRFTLVKQGCGRWKWHGPWSGEPVTSAALLMAWGGYDYVLVNGVAVEAEPTPDPRDTRIAELEARVKELEGERAYLYESADRG